MAEAFHPFPDLPLTLQSDILALALPEHPVIISAFWTLDRETITYALRLPKTPSFESLQNMSQIENEFPSTVPIHLKYTLTTSLPLTFTPSSEETISLRSRLDILYLPFLQSSTCSAKPDVAHFLSCEENQKIKSLAFRLADFEEMVGN